VRRGTILQKVSQEKKDMERIGAVLTTFTNVFHSRDGVPAAAAKVDTSVWGNVRYRLGVDKAKQPDLGITKEVPVVTQPVKETGFLFFPTKNTTDPLFQRNLRHLTRSMTARRTSLPKRPPRGPCLGIDSRRLSNRARIRA
jgi:hypothetical protein